MKQSLIRFFSIIIVVASVTVGTMIPSLASAVNNDNCDSSLPEEVLAASGCSNSSTKAEEDDLPNLIINIINSVVIVCGIVAVVFIIVGGIKFMTSAGNAPKVEAAKHTILYALLGLVICALAYAIVNFVIDNMIN